MSLWYGIECEYLVLKCLIYVQVISMADSPPPVPAPLNEGDETPVAMYALLGQPDLIH